MMLFPRRSAAPKTYRFIARISGRSLPAIDKALRLRCTLSAEDYGIVGVSSMVVHLGTATDCDHVLELIHEGAARDASPPKYFELVASLSPAAEPGSRLHGAFAASGAGDDAEYRIAGIMDAASSRVVLPEIVLRGA